MSTRVWVGGSAVLSSVLVAAWLAFSGGGPTETVNCFPVPSACGYPDLTNTGPTGALTPTPGGIPDITVNGTVIENQDITGGFAVNADNVTIRNSRITGAPGDGGEGDVLIFVPDGSTGLSIEDSEIRGAGTTDDDEFDQLVRSNDDAGFTVTRSAFYNCAHCLLTYGDLSVSDSYILSNAQIHDDADYHFEGIYVDESTVTVDHSTILNPNRQTATVFADTGGGANNYTVTDSLLAGGGFVVYPQANASSSAGTTTITGNRIARCLDSTPVSVDFGEICTGINESWPEVAGENDGHGYYPEGGFFGTFGGTGFNSPGITWSGNVWDDNDEEADGP